MRRNGQHAADLDPERRARHRHDQAVFHELLRRHDAITRHVTQIPGGIEAVTGSDDPALAALIQEHTHAMHRRLEQGFGLRHWDPAFAEIFAQKDKLRMEVEDTATGVRIRETSDDPNVMLLIRTHGAVVSSFVRDGGAAASQESPLPEAYQRVTG